MLLKRSSLLATAMLSGLLVTSSIVEVPGLSEQSAQAASYSSYEKNVFNRVKNKTNYVYQGTTLSGDRFSRYLEYQVIDGKTKINLSNYAKLNRSYVNVNNTKKAIATIMEKPLYKGIVKTATVKKSGGQYYLNLTYAFKSTELKKFVKYVSTEIDTRTKGYASVLINMQQKERDTDNYTAYKKFDRTVVDFLGTKAAKKTVLYYLFGDGEADTLAYNLYAKEVGARNQFAVTVDAKKRYVTATINKKTYVFDAKTYAQQTLMIPRNTPEFGFMPLQMYTLMQQGKELPKNLTVYGGGSPENYPDIFEALGDALYSASDGEVGSISAYIVTTKTIRTIFKELGYNTAEEIEAVLQKNFSSTDDFYFDLDGYFIYMRTYDDDPELV